MADYSLGDIAALMDRDDKGGWGDGFVGWIILLFIFLLAISGNGFFGNGAGSATQASLTTAELYSALGSQDIKNDIRDGFQSVESGICSVDKEILNNRYNTQLGFQNLGQQMQQCCCDLRTTIIEQNQATRDLIQQNYVEGLRTALSDAKAEISNRSQSTYILSQLGQYYTHPSVNPYTCYNNCGCGCGNNLV
nr:MAG TPA: hypothetical protein [Caudoviricetes sp.]